MVSVGFLYLTQGYFQIETKQAQIEESFKSFTKREDIGIILISQYVSSLQNYVYVIIKNAHQDVFLGCQRYPLPTRRIRSNCANNSRNPKQRSSLRFIQGLWEQNSCLLVVGRCRVDVGSHSTNRRFINRCSQTCTHKQKQDSLMAKVRRMTGIRD